MSCQILLFHTFHPTIGIYWIPLAHIPTCLWRVNAIHGRRPVSLPSEHYHRKYVPVVPNCT